MTETTAIETDYLMEERDRNDRGRYTEEYDSDDFLRAVEEHEPASTTEVAATVGCVRQNADYRLRQLEAEGKVTSKKVGPSLVWTARTFTCERCGEELSRADLETVPIVSAMSSVEWHEEAPDGDMGASMNCAPIALKTGTVKPILVASILFLKKPTTDFPSPTDLLDALTD